MPMRLLLSFMMALAILASMLLIFEKKGWLSLHNNRRIDEIQSIGAHREESNRYLKMLVYSMHRINPEKKLHFLDLDPERFLKSAGLSAIGGGLIASWSLGSLVLFPVFTGIAVVLILIYIEKAYQKRINSFESFLEEGIQNIIASLQAGMNLPQSFEVVAMSKTSMVSDVFKRMLDEYHVGLSLQAAVKKMENAIDSPDMLFFSQTIEIYYSSGGDVTEILESMLHMMRRRKHMEGDLEAKTAEVRMTANLLIVLPILLIAYLSSFQTDMIDPLLNEPMGQMVLTAGLVLWGTGVIVVRRLTSIRTLN